MGAFVHCGLSGNHAMVHETRTSHYTGDFDCTSYLGRYPDLQAAFGTNCNKAFSHYKNNGHKEGRDSSHGGHVANDTCAQCEIIDGLIAVTHIDKSFNVRPHPKWGDHRCYVNTQHKCTCECF